MKHKVKIQGLLSSTSYLTDNASMTYALRPLMRQGYVLDDNSMDGHLDEYTEVSLTRTCCVYFFDGTSKPLSECTPEDLMNEVSRTGMTDTITVTITPVHE